MSRILAIEDDAAIRTVLRVTLKGAGFTDVRTAARGDEGLRKARAERPDLVLLDLMLPGMDGFAVCRAIRADPDIARTPVVMLTARGEERDIVKGLELGVDDYITKPFSPPVLVARLRAVLRRGGSAATDARTELDGLVLDAAAHRVTLDGADVALTPGEYGVLALLLAHAERVYTRGQIIDTVHGNGKAVTDRAVDVQLVGLRRKLGAWARHIEAVRGVGYRLSR